jgi:catechol 2,3-dioxygenase-like lactoylglutathione lyase family enzyme
MAVQGVHRITVSVADLDVSLALYRDALGLRQLWRQDGLATLEAPDATQVLLHEREPAPSLAGVAASLAVDDVDEMTQAAVAAGATLLDAPEDQSWGERQSVLLDPDGHVLCLVAPFPPAA